MFVQVSNGPKRKGSISPCGGSTHSSQFLRFFRATEIRKQLALMPESWVFGQFDKGTTVLHGTCKGYFYSQFEQNIFRAQKRFHELERFATPSEGPQHLYALIVGTAHRFFVGHDIPQAALTTGLQVFVNDLDKPPWPTMSRVARQSPDFKHITRKVLATAKLKLQSWARTLTPCLQGKCRRLVKHMRTLLRGLPVPGSTIRKGRRHVMQAHEPHTLQFSRWTAPRIPSPMEHLPSDVVHHYIVPYMGDPKLVLTLFLSSRSMLETGISMLGCMRIGRLDRVVGGNCTKPEQHSRNCNRTQGKDR